MANGFGTLYIGASGLKSSQNGLNTTSNNLANVNTLGYVRQQVIYSDRNYNTYDTTTAISPQQTGLGVKIGDVVHARDVFLDRSFRTISGRQAFYASTAEAIRDLSKTFTYAHNFIYLGRGYNYPAALEGALKLKEISYIHAEGYPAAEMKHGPIALIDAEMPVVAIATTDSIYEKTISNIQEIKARKGKVIAIVSEGDETVHNIADYCIEVPRTAEPLTPIVASIPLQLLAYYIAVNKGRDVDQPRNLAKSVTVE